LDKPSVPLTPATQPHDVLKKGAWTFFAVLASMQILSLLLLLSMPLLGSEPLSDRSPKAGLLFGVFGFFLMCAPVQLGLVIFVLAACAKPNMKHWLRAAMTALWPTLVPWSLVVILIVAGNLLTPAAVATCGGVPCP
jgi:hypothetical protein